MFRGLIVASVFGTLVGSPQISKTLQNYATVLFFCISAFSQKVIKMGPQILQLGTSVGRFWEPGGY